MNGANSWPCSGSRTFCAYNEVIVVIYAIETRSHDRYVHEMFYPCTPMGWQLTRRPLTLSRS
jgi:hypothetical protein